MIDILKKISEISEIEFSDIVEFVEDLREKLRIYLKDGSFMDVWFSEKIQGRYAYHWERRSIDNKIYRHDNIPHKKWDYVKTFPKHFHDGSESNVCDSFISDNPTEAIRAFLRFAREIIRK